VEAHGPDRDAPSCLVSLRPNPAPFRSVSCFPHGPADTSCVDVRDIAHPCAVDRSVRGNRAAWFTERPDKAFYEFMTQLMSDHVEGSIGGNVLADFVISIDYPRAKAWLQ
jgi:hypothetical protein